MPRVPFGVPHKKKGPKPFPGTRRKRCDLRVPPCEVIRRPTIHYPKKRKTQVLEWMLRNRIPEQRTCDSDSYHPLRNRSGEAPISYEELRDRRDVWDSGGVVYRTPTYQDAGKFWRITPGTIVSWWLKKEKYLPAAEIEKLKTRHSLTGRSYDPMPGIPAHPPRPPLNGAPGSQSKPIELDRESSVTNHPATSAEQTIESIEADQPMDEEDEEDDDDDEDENENDDNNEIQAELDGLADNAGGEVGTEADRLVGNVGDGTAGVEENEQDDEKDEDATEDDEDFEHINGEGALLDGDVQNTGDFDDIENSEEFRDLQEDLEDALGEDDPDIIPQVP